MPPVSTITRSAYDVLERARQDAEMYRNPVVTPEHLLFQMESEGVLTACLQNSGKDTWFFRKRLGYFISCLPTVVPGKDYALQISPTLHQTIKDAIKLADEEKTPVNIEHLLLGMTGQTGSLAGYLILKNADIFKSASVAA